MNTKDNRKQSHDMIDRIFHDLLPARGMADRPEQVALSHLMLDALMDGSIALQNAIQTEYLPTLSDVLTADGLIDQPLLAVIRKGKSHYVCDHRLERRLGQMRLCKKNEMAINTLLSLRDRLDMDGVSHLSSFDRAHVCVPQVCDCEREDCRYRAFLEDCDSGELPFQICNHNLSWQMLSTVEQEGNLSCRTPVPSSSTRPTSCRTPPVRCSAPLWRQGTSTA